MEDLIRSDDEAGMMEHLSCHSLEDITADSECSWKYTDLIQYSLYLLESTMPITKEKNMEDVKIPQANIINNEGESFLFAAYVGW